MTVSRIETPGIISLGPLECASSCIMTVLAAFGLNPKHFMLSYWDINYIEGNLLSTRIPWYFDLEAVYGIKMIYDVHERFDSMLAALQAGHMIMHRCKASRLSFFPQELLVHESVGFNHFCLLVDYDPSSHSFTVVDPMVSYIGEISAEEVAGATTDEGKLCYYVLPRPSANFSFPSPAKLLEIGATYNYNTLLHNLNGGLKAFDQFANDLEVSVGWDSARREAWIHSNTITISSTIKTRKWIWESYAALDVLNERQFAAFEALVKEIVTLWTRLNLSLIKYKHRGSLELVASCLQLTTKLYATEKRFVIDMYELCRSMADACGKCEV